MSDSYGDSEAAVGAVTDGTFQAPAFGGTEPEITLGNQFLHGIPEPDRPIVAKYIKDWDGQVTKKFQDYAGRLKPYETLGKPEEIQRYVNLADNLRSDPEGFFKIMWEGLQEQYGDDFENNLLRILQIEAAMTDTNGYQEQVGNPEGGFAQPDPETVWKGNIEEKLTAFEEWQQGQVKEAETQQQIQQLDELFKAMHTRHGEFDENFVLERLAAHGDPEKAIQEFNSMLQKYSQGPRRQPVPKVMGSPGGVPSNQVKPNELRGKERRALVEQMLAQGG